MVDFFISAFVGAGVFLLFHFAGFYFRKGSPEPPSPKPLLIRLSALEDPRLIPMLETSLFGNRFIVYREDALTFNKPVFPEPAVTGHRSLMHLAQQTLLEVRDNYPPADDYSSVLTSDTLDELFLALCPELFTGKRLTVTLDKGGEGDYQGVGYLPSGEMVVVDHGKDSVGKTVVCEISNVIETKRGKIVFSTLVKELQDGERV